MEILIFLIPIAIALFGFWIGRRVILRRPVIGFVILLTMGHAGAGALYVGMENAVGYDGIPYALGLFFGDAPVMGGLLLGGLVGHVANRSSSA